MCPQAIDRNVIRKLFFRNCREKEKEKVKGHQY